jgi:hypothetical protein
MLSVTDVTDQPLQIVQSVLITPHGTAMDIVFVRLTGMAKTVSSLLAHVTLSAMDVTDQELLTVITV